MTEQERLAAALEYQQAQQPARMNPNLAAQGARGRENMMPPTSIMDERYPAFKRNQEDVEKLMLGLDIVGSAIPLAGPAAKGAVALGKYSAPQIAQGLENYAFRTGMALPMVERQAGRTFAAPQDEALRLAQERAALPVEQGGLGLPPNNTAEQRAAAMGFNTTAYHGTHSDVPVFDRSKNVTAKDIYSSPNPSESGSYAEGAGGNVMPLLLRGGVKDLTQESKYVENQLRKAYNAQVQASERKYYPFEQFKDSFMQGQLYQDTGGQSAQNALVSELIGNKKSILKIPDAVSGAGVGESYVVANPDNIRSRFAAFDPFRRNAAIAAAMGVAAPDLLAKDKK